MDGRSFGGLGSSLACGGVARRGLGTVAYRVSDALLHPGESVDRMAKRTIGAAEDDRFWSSAVELTGGWSVGRRSSGILSD